MYLKQTKRKNGTVYLSIMHAYRESGKNKARTVKSLGSLEKLRELYDDPIAHFKEECERMNEEEATRRAPLAVEFHIGQKIDKRKQGFVDLGAAVVLKYLHELGVERFFDNRRRRTSFSYDPCRILELLVANRIASPCSKKAAWEARGAFPRKCDFSLDDVYRSLDYLNHHATRLVSCVNDAIRARYGSRGAEAIYYDVTNYYFECDPDEGLRRRGCSKEHRPNPIVQMGLMIDSEGIPIGYDVLPGNTNDCLTMMPAMKQLRARNLSERAIVVADKGLNTSDNIAACILDGNGYVFSQSVRKADRSLQKWVLDDAGYDVREGFKLKSKIRTKEISVRDKDGKVIESESVPVRLVAFWSEDYAKRAAAQRETAIAKAAKLVTSRASYEHAKTCGAGRYVTEVFVDGDTGECQRSVVSLDEAAIEADARFDGYYCIVTSELDKSPQEIIDIYRGLWRIEESFRVIKGDFSARPVYVSTDAHIRAHFLICYLALIVTRLMQKDTGNRYSAHQIAEAVSGLKGMHMKENWYLFAYRTDVTDALGKAAGMDLARQVYSRRDIADMVAGIKKS